MSSFDPTKMYDKYPGSTVEASQTTTPKVVTTEIQFPDGSSAKKVEQDYTANKYNTVPSAYALFQGLNRLQQNINAIDPDSNFFRDNTVVSLPLIDTHFSMSAAIPWSIKGWMVIDEVAVYTGTGNNDNYLRIPQEAFTFPSYYHFNMVVKRLDSGMIRVYDHLNRLVTETDKVGEFDIEMYIAEPDLTTLRIVAEQVYVGDSIHIETVGLHLVTDRFRDYFVAMLKNGELVVGIDAEQGAKIAQQIANATVAPCLNQINMLNTDLLDHINRRDNPHGVTRELLGAAASDHVHTDLLQLAEKLTGVAAHLSDYNNPHETTYQQVGAAPANHTHTPKQIAAAPEVHDHDDVYAPLEFVNTVPGLVEEYVKRTTGSGVSSSGTGDILIMTEYPYAGQLPPGGEGLGFTGFAPLFRFNYNLHASTWDYDYQCGLAHCNKPILSGSYAGLAFSDYYGKSADFDIVPIAEDPVVLTYTFNMPRSFSSYRVYKGTTVDVTGFITDWEFWVDGKKVDEQNAVVWSSFSVLRGGNLQRTVDVKNCTTVQFIIKGVSTSASDGKWGFRVSFGFNETEGPMHDAEDFTLDLAEEFTSRYISTSEMFKKDTPRHYQYGADTTPMLGYTWWMFLRKKLMIVEIPQETTDPNGPNSPIYSTQTTLDLDASMYLPPEYSQQCNGTDALVDKFTQIDTTGAHPRLGTISCDYTDALHPISNVYSSEDNYWLTTRALWVRFTHVFRNSLKYPGLHAIRMRWSKELLEQNCIPKSIRISAVGETLDADSKKVESSGLVLDVPDFFYDPNKARSLGYVEQTWKLATPYVTLTTVVVEFNYNSVRPGQTVVGLSELGLLGVSHWVDPATRDSNNTDLFCMGKFEALAKPDTCLLKLALRHGGIPTSRTMTIPVKDFDMLFAGEYKVDNPFWTVDVATSVVSKPIATASLEEPSTIEITAAEVIHVDREYITVRINYPGRYGLKVTRLW